MPLAVDYSNLPYRDEQGSIINPQANISEHIIPQPFQGDTFLEKGIHLHWALPDALTRGSANQKKIDFPLVPNRWLVARISSIYDDSKKLKLDIKTWVIESDRITRSSTEPQPGSTVIPYPPDIKTDQYEPFAYLGKTFKGEEWAEDITQKDCYVPFTAIGPGEPDFAAFYPKCRGVFGFYDPLMEDIFNQGRTTSVTYAVIGWYDKLENDCLQKKQDLSKMLDELGWSLSQTIPSTVGPTLFHGIIKEIQWDPNRTYLDQDSPAVPTIAVGNTTTEALSALLSNGDSTKERLLNALQLGLLDKLDQPDGILLLEEALHQSYFNSFASGKLWTIEKKSSQDSQTLTEHISSVLLEKLAKLNASQEAYEAIYQQIASLRWQIFADWYKYMVTEHPQTGVVKDVDLVKKLYNHITDEIKNLNNLISKKIEKEHEFQFLFEELQTQTKDHYILKEKPGPRFWQPQDPVVLLKGDIVNPPLRYGGDGRFEEDGKLKCRLIEEVITGLRIKENTIEGCDPYTLNSQDLIKSFDIINSPLRSSFKLLLGEALLLDSQFTPFLIQEIIAQGGKKNPAILNQDFLKKLLEDAQAHLLENLKFDNNGIEFIGTPPSPLTFHTWKQPWLPIILQWKVRYYPVHALDVSESQEKSYPKEIMKEKFSLEENSLDLIYKGSAPKAFQEYIGEAYLTPGARTNLKNQIETYFSHDKDNKVLKEIKKEIEGLSLLAQSLDGFNAALLMQKKTAQFKVGDPIASSDRFDEFSNESVPIAVENANSLAPESSNAFNPLRGGFLEIIQLRLVDAYGRFKDIKNPALIRASHLQPAKDFDKRTNIYLAPRFSQPCQLDFKLLPTLNNFNEGEELLSNPICGWILSNELDRSLMVFSTDGKALGALSVSADESHIRWQTPPGKDSAKKSIEQALEGSDPYFRNFILSLYKNDARFFTEFRRTLDRSISLIELSDFQRAASVIAFFGRPLAVVRSQVGIELKGPAAYSQSWTYFKPNVTPSDRSTGEVCQVEMPIKMGDIRKINDGLVGFYIETQDPHYTHFYASNADNKHDFISKSTEFTIPLNADKTAKSTLLMIMDPHAQVHATTGILPTKSIEIPSSFYKEAIRNFEVTFLTAPILSDKQAITFPIPVENGLEWAWLQNKDGEWETFSTIKPAVENANFNYCFQEIYEGWLKLIKPFEN